MKRVPLFCAAALLGAALIDPHSAAFSDQPAAAPKTGPAPSAAAPAAPAEPPPPQPSAAVQKLLQEGVSFEQSRQFPQALEAADRALSVAREAGNSAGQALANRMRANALEHLSRTDEAVAAWREAGAAWQRASEGPGRVAALTAAALHLTADRPGDAEALLSEALMAAKTETRRPLAAAGALHSAAHSFDSWARLSEARRLWEADLAIQETLTPGSLGVARSLRDLGLAAARQGICQRRRHISIGHWPSRRSWPLTR